MILNRKIGGTRQSVKCISHVISGELPLLSHETFSSLVYCVELEENSVLLSDEDM